MGGARADLGLDLFHQLRGRNIGQTEIQHDAVQVLLLHHRQGFPAGSHRDNLHIAAAQSLLPVSPAGLLLRDDQQLLGAPLQRVMNGIERRRSDCPW